MALKFPLVVKEGSISVKIYRTPLVVDKPVVRQGGRKTKPTTYDSYTLSYYLAGKRVRQRFNELAEAKTEAQAVIAKIQSGRIKALELTGDDREQYVVAVETLKEFNQNLDSAMREYVEAKRIIKGSTLIEAARFFHRFGQSMQLKTTVPELVAKLVKDLRSDKKSEYHVGSLESRLERFAQQFPGQILDIKTEEINQWLRKLKGKNAKGEAIEYAGKTRNHFRNSVVQLFNYARTHGFLPKGLPTEAEATVMVQEDHPENEIFTVEEMTKLMTKAPKHLVAAMAIKAFSGVRTEEICNMQWEHVDFEKGYIILPASITKTNNRRLIPLAANLRAWLEPFKLSKGRVCTRWARPQAVFQAFDRYGKRQGIDVGANKYRNSYISYRVALTKNVAEVALESGNSPRIIQNEYLQLTTAEEGVRWFNIMPPDSVKLTSLDNATSLKLIHKSQGGVEQNVIVCSLNEDPKPSSSTL